MKAKDNLDQLAVMLFSGAGGVLVGGLLFDEVIRQLSVYSAGIAFVCGMAIGLLHLIRRL